MRRVRNRASGSNIVLHRRWVSLLVPQRLIGQGSKGPIAVLDLNNYNLIFITLGMILHWRPRRFLKAVAQAVLATGGVLIQFPFYAVIFGMIVGTGINKWLANLFQHHDPGKPIHF